MQTGFSPLLVARHYAPPSPRRTVSESGHYLSASPVNSSLRVSVLGLYQVSLWVACQACGHGGILFQWVEAAERVEWISDHHYSHMPALPWAASWLMWTPLEKTRSCVWHTSCYLWIPLQMGTNWLWVLRALLSPFSVKQPTAPPLFKRATFPDHGNEEEKEARARRRNYNRVRLVSACGAPLPLSGCRWKCPWL